MQDGSIYDGNWRHGKPHGKGVHKFADGYQYKGVWKNGDCIEKIYGKADKKRSTASSKFYKTGDDFSHDNKSDPQRYIGNKGSGSRKNSASRKGKKQMTLADRVLNF